MLPPLPIHPLRHLSYYYHLLGPPPRHLRAETPGLFVGHRPPYTLVTNLAGIVQAFGLNTSAPYNKGDHIFGQASLEYPALDRAGLQQYAVLDITTTAKVPAGFTEDQVVSLPVNATTSFIALFHTSMGFGFDAPFGNGKYNNANQTLIIIGAGTNVGKRAIQFAKLARITSVIAIASKAREQELITLGAMCVIDRHLPQSEIAALVYAKAGRAENVTHMHHWDVIQVYDCASWMYKLAISLLATDSASTSLALHAIDAETIVKERPRCEVIFVSGTSQGLGDLNEGIGRELPGWLERGLVKCPEVRFVEGLNEREVNAALDAYRDGTAGKGVVVHPNA